jgi:hypothetical protein
MKRKPTVEFLGSSWEILGDFEKLNKYNKLEKKYFRFLVSKRGERFIVVHTVWSPNRTKDSPRHCKCHDKYLLKCILPGELALLEKELIRGGFKSERSEII